ncbi:beta-glucoside-specific PTS transporter subunit IIABC [Vibrio sp. ABG19]|uniref:beta-glucoside-specific PTS transporter subunit IIABC n=1 Tax=Vibrio sp. ABG19 TaxID=2817385 RepID=UPI00249F5B5B|nr:beta-glucoside-specific PTS transporter subunit IIABC [Vibrio sp. ABG19]WGY46638.1 PTS glucose transporter subunit IIA [Vibrio sp. ABG19]
MQISSDYYDRLARQIITKLGGTSNVMRVTHCTTRLRFQLKQIPADAVKEIQQLPEVISVMLSGGLFQIVIGTQVEKLFQSVTPLIDTAENHNLPGHVNTLINTITNIFNPILWFLSAAGILKGTIILCVIMGWLGIDTGTYRILYSAADTVFFFLPILLGYTASKHFGSNPLFGITIAGALVHPEITNHVNTLFSQQAAAEPPQQADFLGLPLQFINYSNSVIPVLFATWFNVWMERRIPKSLPEYLYKWLAPFLCLMITIPLTFLVIGPLSTTIAQTISTVVFFLYHSSPVIAGMIIGAIWQVLVVFGIHWGLAPIVMSNIAVNGFDVIPPLLVPAVFGQVGACLGIVLKYRKQQSVAYAGSAAVTAMFGVTEPAIYCITLPRRWPFIFGCFSASIGSGIAAYFYAKAYSPTMPGLFSILQFIPPTGVDNSVYATILGTLLTLLLAISLTYFFTPTSQAGEKTMVPAKTETSAETDMYNLPAERAKSRHFVKISSPLSGQVVALSMVGDPTFASEIMGQGVAIIPDSGELRAPFDGKVASVFKTHHSIGLQSEDGVEMLIHIGIDSVKLNGKGFELLVEAGQEVAQGQILIQFDLQVLTTLGYDTTTPIVITNSDDYLDVIVTNSARVSSGDPLMTLV